MYKRWVHPNFHNDFWPGLMKPNLPLKYEQIGYAKYCS